MAKPRKKAKPRAARPLSAKALVFVDQYPIDMNATQAAIRAGFSSRSARVTAQRMLADPRIAALLAAKATERGEKTGITAERILSELFLIGTADIGEAFNDNMTLKALKDMPEPIRRAISAIDVDEIMSGSGKDAVKIGETKKVKFWNKEKGLELLGRHLRLFADVIQHDVTDRLADAMREAEARIAARG